MSIVKASIQITTDKIAESKSFYQTCFDATVFFDCGWYVSLRLGPAQSAPEISLMEPRDGAAPFTSGATLNLLVPDVDGLHTKIVGKGLTPIVPLEDHPWGDRGFGVLDPNGLQVYCYTEIEPTAEFKRYFKA